MKTTRTIVYTAIIAALYFVLSIFVAPIAYGPLQLRISTFLFPLALFNPVYILGFGLGNFLTNLGSPFGPWDFAIMPFVAIGAGYVAWILRRFPVLAISIQPLIVSLGVSIFPLHFGGQLPVWVTFPGVFISQLLINLAAWFLIWRPFKGKGILENR